MPLKHAKLTIALLIAGFYHCLAAAGDTAEIPAALSTAPAVPAAAKNLPDVLPPAALATPATTLAPASPSPDSPEDKNSTADTLGAGTPDQTSIISIESAPNDATPLLKAADSLGDPQHDLWARIRVGFALSELNTDLVQENEQWYGKRPDYVARMLERSKRYLFYIVEAVEKRGMPTEIALLPMIESAFNPKAYSRAHAAGLWQFIPSTGRNYGLKQNWWVDSRRDVIAGTNAALDYLQKLHDMFGTWELALAAYNWGEGSVQRAIARNQAKGLPTDYLSLRMPRETQQYVPRLMAIKNLILRPQEFATDLGVLPNTPYFAQITLTQHIDVALAAKLAETTLEEFTSLNPHYTRPVIQTQQPAALLLPVDKAEIFAANLENYDKPLVTWQPYHAKRGEKLAAIASRYGISSLRLQEANGLQLKRGRLGSNQVLLVPGSGGDRLDNVSFREIKTESEDSGGKIYSVRKGDTLLSIAKRNGVKPEQIKAWNHLRSNRLALNQKLRLGHGVKTDAKPTKVASTSTTKRAGSAKTPSKQKQYTVRRGDTLYSIAQRFDVDLDDLRRWNKLSHKARLHPGDKVTILLARNG
jgi:membrane-bound lytic murein transglycosylase D